VNIQINFKSGNMSKVKIPYKNFEEFVKEFVKDKKWLFFENALYDTNSIEAIFEIIE